MTVLILTYLYFIQSSSKTVCLFVCTLMLTLPPHTHTHTHNPQNHYALA